KCEVMLIGSNVLFVLSNNIIFALGNQFVSSQTIKWATTCLADQVFCPSFPFIHASDKPESRFESTQGVFSSISNDFVKVNVITRYLMYLELITFLYWLF